MKSQVYTEKEYKQLEKESESRFSDHEYCLMGWDEKRQAYTVVYNVVGVLYIAQSVQAMQEGNELPTAVQLVQPQAALDEIAELEKKYRETIERENK